MAGFRDTANTAAILRMFELPWLDAVAAELADTPTPFQSLRRVVTEMLATSGEELTSGSGSSVSPPRRPRRVRTVLRAGCARSTSSRAAWSVRACASSPRRKALVDRYPDDAGVLVTLLLNHVVLAAGEAMFIAAGVIHAYTSGFGVEIMAASDNVLRAGLTPKYVDIPELLEITNFTPIPPPLWAGTPVTDADGIKLAPPVEEFELVVASIDGEEPVTDDVRPMIVLCLDGELRVSTAGVGREAHPGRSRVRRRLGRQDATGRHRALRPRPHPQATRLTARPSGGRARVGKPSRVVELVEPSRVVELVETTQSGGRAPRWLRSGGACGAASRNQRSADYSRRSPTCSRYHATVDSRPSRIPIFAVQPSPASLLTSSSFCGVPSGLLVSQWVLPS